MKWIDNLLANNWIPDWVKIESVDWKGFQMWLQSKRKMHQKLNYAFNQNLFFSNCIQFENFLQSYIIWNFFATVYHLKTVHIIFSTWYGGIQHVGLPIKAGLARALKSSIFLSGSVIVSHLRSEWRKVIMSDADSGLALGRCVWHICQLYQALQLFAEIKQQHSSTFIQTTWKYFEDSRWDKIMLRLGQ